MGKSTKKTGSVRMERAKAEIRMKDRARKERKLQRAMEESKHNKPGLGVGKRKSVKI